MLNDRRCHPTVLTKVFTSFTLGNTSDTTSYTQHRLDAEKEVIGLKKRLREVEMENEIIKKAALIFGRGG